MSKKVLCFGLVMADVLVSGMKELPDDWERTIGGDCSFISVGGGASNSARTFGKLGVEVDLLGRAGNDYFADFVRNECERDGVNCAHLIKDATATTGVAIGLVHKSGQRCFITTQGANRNLKRVDFDSISPDNYDFLHINGYFQFPGIEPDLREILERFHAHGVPISFDTAGSDPFGRWYEAIADFVDMLDYVFLNEKQLEMMTHEKNADQGAKWLLEAGAEKIIIKLGERGCAIYQKNMEKLTVPGLTLPVVDTTGAGDSFDAAYIVGVRKGWPDEKCAAFANIVAGYNCCKFGATSGVIGFEQAMAILERGQV